MIDLLSFVDKHCLIGVSSRVIGSSFYSFHLPCRPCVPSVCVNGIRPLFVGFPAGYTYLYEHGAWDTCWFQLVASWVLSDLDVHNCLTPSPSSLHVHVHTHACTFTS